MTAFSEHRILASLAAAAIESARYIEAGGGKQFNPKVADQMCQACEERHPGNGAAQKR